MNKIRRTTALLVAVVFTLIAIAGHQYIPEKRFVATPNPAGTYFLYSTNLSDGSPAGFWLDQEKRHFRCVYPENPPPGYYCSFNQIHVPELSTSSGIDLSGYDRLNVTIGYAGATPKLRMFVRNFNARYSSPLDTNSTKYSTLFIPEQNMNRETTIKLSQFKVAEWWLIAYNIPIEEAHPELDNVVNLGVDFSDFMTPGNHDVTIEKIEFIGDAISKEKWYLAILSVWLFGLGSYAVNELRLLRAKNLQDISVINRLNKSNAILQKETDRFRRLSTVDGLTQIYNRFGIDQVMSSLLETKLDGVQQDAPPVRYSLAVLDLDLFKQVNDTRGHDCGDRVLRDAAALITYNLRDGDYVGRWGGEEFIIVLPDTSKEEALALAEKIRLAIAGAVFEADNPLAITVSIGVGERHGDEDFASTFKRVDDALYSAKISGRNRCTLAP